MKKLVFVALLGASALAHADILLNGGLENYHNSFGAVLNLAPGNPTISNWTIERNNLAWWYGSAFGISPVDGECFVDLYGYHDSSPSSRIFQSVPTVPGQNYTINFWVGNYVGLFAQARVSAAGTFGDFACSGPGNNWAPHSWTFTASSTATVVSFESGPLSTPAHVGIDGIHLRPTGTPGTITGKVSLSDYSISPIWGQNIIMSFRPTGTTGTPVQMSAFVDRNGHYAYTLPSSIPPGVYDISCDATPHLRRNRSLVTITADGAVGVDFTLPNGDCDDSGEVDAADIDFVIAAFGDTEGLADVDGSGEVDAADIDIVIAYFGSVDE